MATSDQTIQDVGVPAARIEAFRYLYESGCFADLIITCRGREWKVHKTCILTLSDFFKAALTHDFKERREGTIDLDDDPELVDAMIRYCYLFKYPEREDDPSPMLRDIRIYIIADKYLVQPLKELAVQSFQKRAESGWASQDFADAAGKVYEIPYKLSRDLHKIVINMVMRHLELVVDIGANGKAFQQVMSAEMGGEICFFMGKRIVRSEQLSITYGG